MSQSNDDIGEDFKSLADTTQTKCNVTSLWFWLPAIVCLFMLTLLINYSFGINNSDEPIADDIKMYVFGATITSIIVSYIVGHITRRHMETKKCGNKLRQRSQGGYQSIYDRFPSLAGIAAESKNEVLGGISNPFYMA